MIYEAKQKMIFAYVMIIITFLSAGADSSVIVEKLHKWWIVDISCLSRIPLVRYGNHAVNTWGGESFPLNPWLSLPFDEFTFGLENVKWITNKWTHRIYKNWRVIAFCIFLLSTSRYIFCIAKYTHVNNSKTIFFTLWFPDLFIH